MRSFNARLLCFLASVAAPAAAQLDTPPPQTPPVNTGTSPENVGNGVPDVNDSMLDAVEAPRHVLENWRQALALVRSQSTTVATARARIIEANARSRQALSLGLPEIGATGSVRRNLLFGTGVTINDEGQPTNTRLPYPATVWNAGLSLRAPVFDLRTWHDVSTSKTAIEAASASAKDAERLVLGSLADTIVTVTTAERLAEVSRVSLRSNLSTLDLTERRMRLGAASSVDVLRAQQEVASNRLDVVQADEGVRRAREALGMALGFPEGWGVAPNIKVDEMATDAKAVCAPISAPEERSDVLAAKLNLDVSQRNVASVGYGYAPTVDVVSDFTYTTQPQSVRPVQWSIGAVLTVPIYDGGRLASERGLNVATAEVARQQLTEATRQASIEGIQAQRSIQVAQANFSVSRQARDIAEESARLSRIAFVHGTGTSFDLVESARRQRLAEIDVTIKEFEVIRARITALLVLSNCNI
jgi:outer membrane protein, multidrug efflux system